MAEDIHFRADRPLDEASLEGPLAPENKDLQIFFEVWGDGLSIEAQIGGGKSLVYFYPKEDAIKLARAIFQKYTHKS